MGNMPMGKMDDEEMPMEEMEEEVPEEGREEGGADQMNAMVQDIVAMVDDLVAMAKETGVYNDRASISSLQDLKGIAQEISDHWMAQREGDEAVIPEHEPMKLLPKEEELEKQSPFGRPRPGPKTLKKTNQWGGQIRNF